MDIEKVIAQSEENIRQALRDYAAHTSQTEVMDDVSDKFIKRLAKDNAYAKMELRELFSQSPVYDAKLDALVINGTRTHNPDQTRIERLAREILLSAVGKTLDNGVVFDNTGLRSIAYFFSGNYSNEGERNEYLAVIKSIAPKAYKEGRKPSRVFKQICQALGIADETAGSQFQRLYAQFADELTTRKIGFKLFVSLNPAHFITMSNPKHDERGNTLTSCHSFNSTEYDFNNGCTGYARDNYTFIVFTVDDPSVTETLNNRKTTRQIFAYKPGNGLLLQSRMYNTSGGVYGAAEDSKLYRDLVQREISALEDVPNLWKTRLCVDDEDGYIFDDCVSAGVGFGGYKDWTYKDFDAHISIRADHADDWEPLTIGTWGLCVVCADETNMGVYCSDCKDGCRHETYTCDECGEDFDDEDDLYTVRNSGGQEILVCEDCRDRYYTKCDDCGEYHFDDDMTEAHRADGSTVQVCPGCLSEHFEECAGCGEFYEIDALEEGLCPNCATTTPTSEGEVADDNETEESA